MNYAPQAIQIDIVVTGVCALVWLTRCLCGGSNANAAPSRESKRGSGQPLGRARQARAGRAGATDSRRQVCHRATAAVARDADRRRIARDLHDDWASICWR